MGGGGNRERDPSDAGYGTQGSPSSIVGPNITTITSTGGGAGANLDSTPNNGGGGGSGGGAAHGNPTGQTEDSLLLSSRICWRKSPKSLFVSYFGAGGGGAGGAGGNASPNLWEMVVTEREQQLQDHNMV